MTTSASPPDKHQQLLSELEQFARTAPSAEVLMERISSRLHAEMARYNWVGFYVVDRVEPEALALGPFTGSFTPHSRIAFSDGLCGAAARSGQTVVVNDVRADERYLEGSGQTRSEIVVPILVRQKVVAELDINSYFAATFAGDERSFVEACAALVGRYLEKRPA